MPIAGFFSRPFQENKPLMTAKGCRLIIAHFTHPTATDFYEANIMWQIHPYSLAIIRLSGQLSPMDGAGAPGETGKFISFWLEVNIGILLPKLFWPTVRKNCSSDREKLLKFEAEDREFANFLRSLEQFIQTVKGQNNFW